MDAQSFELLEEKINKMITTLNLFKTENKELKMQNQELRSLLDNKEQMINTLNNEKEQLKSVQGDVESYKQNQNRIKEKVDSLLLKLKEFEDYQ
ncbi:cell division protein ZapB [bacterium]|nr:cell division protein ZapB [bacterium]